MCLSVQVGVSIQMSSFNLTRIVTMSPFYTLVNKSSYELEVGEVTSQTSTKWHYISSTEVNMLVCPTDRVSIWQSPRSLWEKHQLWLPKSIGRALHLVNKEMQWVKEAFSFWPWLRLDFWPFFLLFNEYFFIFHVRKKNKPCNSRWKAAKNSIMNLNFCWSTNWAFIWSLD